MRKLLTVLVTLVMLLFGWGVITPCFASANILFILDSSGSMWGKVDNVAKITTAKKVLKGILKDLPKDANVGLIAYGHRKKEDCKDVEVLAPISSNDPGKLAKNIDALEPKGKTPLTYSLEQTLPLFASLKGQNNSVVLVSDGKETCGGEPCAAAGKLARAGVGLKLHVVGFDVSAEERKQLECIAEQGKGRYFNAENAKGLEKALAEVKEEIKKKAPPPPPKKKATEYFFDDFKGEALEPHWEVIKPNLDNYIVEDGALLILSSTQARVHEGTVENLVRLTKELPKGDWIATAKLDIDFQTLKELIFFGLYENKDNYIITFLSTARGSCHPGGSHSYHLYMFPTKRIKGKRTQDEKEVWNVPRDCKDGSGRDYNPRMKRGQPILLRLQKKGRAYFFSIMLKGTKKPKWIELGKQIVLRAMGRLAFGVYQHDKAGGETSITVDWVKIETLE